MGKNINKFILATLFGTTSMFGASFEHKSNTQSLVGVEFGYSSINIESDATPAYRKLHKMGDGGFKVGVQSDEYRVFIGGRYYGSSDLDYMNTIGADFQYMFDFSKYANFYVGLNGGIASLKMVDGTGLSRTISDNYFGGDAGFNIHACELIDVELGARMMSLQAKNDQKNITYTFDNIISGYASVIIKYNMD